MIHSVSKEMITVIQCVPRIAERVTPATAAQLKVECSNNTSYYSPPWTSYNSPLCALLLQTLLADANMPMSCGLLNDACQGTLLQQM